MKLLREEYKKLSKFVVLFVIPWLILFNLLLCWLDMTFPRFPLPLFLLLYALIIAALFSLGYVCGKRRCPVLALAVGCLQYLLYNLLSFLPISLGLEHSWHWSCHFPSVSDCLFISLSCRTRTCCHCHNLKPRVILKQRDKSLSDHSCCS